MCMKRIRRIPVLLLTVFVLMLPALAQNREESASAITFTLGIYDYAAVFAHLDGASTDGIVLADAAFEVPVGTSAADAVRTALDAAGITYHCTGSYFESFGTLGAGEGYSGWLCKYNNDDFANFGLDAITLQDGDILEFHYTANFDTQTDDVGHGWYGMPILTRLEIAGTSLTFSKKTEYDADYNANTTYCCGETVMPGKGTFEEPFSVTVYVAPETDCNALTAVYETSLLAPYRKVNVALDQPQDYRTPLFFSLSTPGGFYQSYYRISIVPDVFFQWRNSPVNLTRGEFVAVLAACTAEERDFDAKLLPFDDVTADNPYCDAVLWAKNAGIVYGYGDGSFGSEKEITFEEAAVMFDRYAAAFRPEFVQNAAKAYSDSLTLNEVEPWAAASVSRCAAWGLLTPDAEGVWQGKENFTGGQAVTAIEKLLKD